MTELRHFEAMFRAEVSGNTITGTAAVFDQVTQPVAGSRNLEAIAPGAFDRAMEDPATDVRATFNHSKDMILGRQSAGTLRLHRDNSGLAFEIDLPDTSYANDLRALIARGDVSGASFAVIPGKMERSRVSDGRTLVRHTDFARFIDVSVVAFPAYEGTQIALRSLNLVPQRDWRSDLIRAKHNHLHGGN